MEWNHRRLKENIVNHKRLWIKARYREKHHYFLVRLRTTMRKKKCFSFDGSSHTVLQKRKTWLQIEKHKEKEEPRGN